MPWRAVSTLLTADDTTLPTAGLKNFGFAGKNVGFAASCDAQQLFGSPNRWAGESHRVLGANTYYTGYCGLGSFDLDHCSVLNLKRNPGRAIVPDVALICGVGALPTYDCTTIVEIQPVELRAETGPYV